ncbi:unnamed protein product, partial [marine sediment metagenome]
GYIIKNKHIPIGIEICPTDHELISNWIVAPLVGLMMARIFLPGHEQLIVAIILLSASPCTAMVLVWGWMARGNQEQNVTNTSLNTITIIFLYV